ncbi:hypothetical protein DYU11_20015 [Fibrisoma montanum]|uniref:Uncharacterized protein n=1 Tax=Fibrisoma montanum TaxID=2305895 RepID=A0A418M3L3_9BACT|nr:hypothetical protein [Fibrisoma montanum]RIV20340.1 hypothetical protein DYU11_20015 [Fibrisoma montanum]
MDSYVVILNPEPPTYHVTVGEEADPVAVTVADVDYNYHVTTEALVLPPYAGGGTGGPGQAWPGSFLHTQSTPASVWTINHNLGYRPAGIVVRDSAGSLWAYEVEYLTTNTLTLSFGNAQFAGSAYLS